jgi:hypothetical protein
MVLRSNGFCNGHRSGVELKAWLGPKVNELYAAAQDMNADAIKAKIKEIVPEYTPQKTRCVL